MSNNGKSLAAVNTEFMSILREAVSDPKITVEKMNGLLDVQERIMDKRAEQDFWRDFTKLQKNLPSIGKGGEILDKHGKVRSRYSRYDEDIHPIIKPLLAENGFSIVHHSVGKDTSSVVVKTVLTHKSGHQIASTTPLSTSKDGYMNDTQAVGSARSYAKRYNVIDLLDLTCEGQDDDGNAASRMEQGISRKEIQELNALIDTSPNKEMVMKKIRKEWQVDNIGQIKPDEFYTVLNRVGQYIAKQKHAREAREAQQ